jgi:glycosyl transferase family 25
MNAQFARVGLTDDPRLAFFDALSFEDPGPFRRKGSRGNFMSRIPLLREASAAGESILILEDDCDFLLPQINEFVMPDSWDIFYGGYTPHDPTNLAASDIVGSHFMAFSPRAAGAVADYLTAYLKPDFEPDVSAAAEPGFDPTIRPPIDGALVWFRRAYPEFRTVFAMLGVQRSSRTDVGDQRWFDKIGGLREFAGFARRISRRLRTGHGGTVVFTSAGLDKP